MKKTRGEATMSIDSEISADVCTFHISSPIHIVLYGYPENDYLNPNLKAIMDIMGIYIESHPSELLFYSLWGLRQETRQL